MKKRWPLILLFVALAALAFWLWQSSSNSTLAGPLSDFAIADTASVDRIFIADKNGGVADLRRLHAPDKGESWTVNGVPAKDFQVQLLLKTFKRVELRTPVPKSAEATVLRVMAGLATKVEIYQGGKRPTKIWWVGQSSQDHFGTYMLLEVPGLGKSSVPYVMGMSGFTGVLNTRFHTHIDDWRSSVVTNYPDLEKVHQITLEQPDEHSEGWTIEYEGGNNFKLLNSKGMQVEMDSNRVKNLMLHVRRSNFEYLERDLGPAKKDSVLASPPWHILSITSENGIQRIPFWKKLPRPGERDMLLELVTTDNERMYALLGDSTFVVVQRQWFDQMTPPLSKIQAPGDRSNNDGASAQ